MSTRPPDLSVGLMITSFLSLIVFMACLCVIFRFGLVSFCRSFSIPSWSCPVCSSKQCNGKSGSRLPLFLGGRAVLWLGICLGFKATALWCFLSKLCLRFLMVLVRAFLSGLGVRQNDSPFYSTCISRFHSSMFVKLRIRDFLSFLFFFFFFVGQLFFLFLFPVSICVGFLSTVQIG